MTEFMVGGEFFLSAKGSTYDGVLVEGCSKVSSSTMTGSL